MPIGSWPMMSPGLMNGPSTSYRCRSEPQIAVEVTRMRASVGCWIVGSGTVSTLTCSVPCQVTALMVPPPGGELWVTVHAMGAARSCPQSRPKGLGARQLGDGGHDHVVDLPVQRLDRLAQLGDLVDRGLGAGPRDGEHLDLEDMPLVADPRGGLAHPWCLLDPQLDLAGQRMRRGVVVGARLGVGEPSDRAAEVLHPVAEDRDGDEQRGRRIGPPQPEP